MKKARFLSFIHSLGLAALVALAYNYGASIIMTCVLTGVEGLKSNSLVEHGINLVRSSTFWMSILQDVSLAEPFSILFTTVFSVVNIYLMCGDLELFLHSKWSSIGCVLIYLTLCSTFFMWNDILPISKFTVFLLALIIIIFDFFIHVKNAPLWTSMDEPPQYHTCSVLSLFILVVSTLLQGSFIILVMKLITNFLTYLFNIFVFPQIVGFIATRIVIFVATIAMIMSWQMLGRMHDRIIAQLHSCK